MTDRSSASAEYGDVMRQLWRRSSETESPSALSTAIFTVDCAAASRSVTRWTSALPMSLKERKT